MELEVPPIQESTPEPATPAWQDRRTQLLIIGGAILVLALLITAIVLMAKFPATTVVIRDIAIVFVAVTTFFIGIAMLVLIVQIQALIQVLQEEVRPLLASVNDTASTVRGTTEFVSENLVSPLIKAAGFTAAIRRVAGELHSVVAALRPRSDHN